MTKQKTIYQKLTDLAKEYSDYSYSKFGWQDTYITKKDEDYFLSLNYNNDLGKTYFAATSDHRSVTFGYGLFKEVQISMHSTPVIEFAINQDLEKTLEKYTEILKKIKQFHDQESIKEENKRKLKLKASLLKQLESLK